MGSPAESETSVDKNGSLGDPPRMDPATSLYLQPSTQICTQLFLLFVRFLARLSCRDSRIPHQHHLGRWTSQAGVLGLSAPHSFTAALTLQWPDAKMYPVTIFKAEMVATACVVCVPIENQGKTPLSSIPIFLEIYAAIKRVIPEDQGYLQTPSLYPHNSPNLQLRGGGRRQTERPLPSCLFAAEGRASE